MSTRFTIAIPTYRRSRMLARVLPSYLACEPVDVIVVDDGSGPPHTDRIRSVAREAGVRLITLPRNLGSPNARNMALREVTTDWVVFGEDDVWFTPEFASLLIEHIQSAGAQVGSGESPLVDPALLDGPIEALDGEIRSKPMLDTPPDRFLGAPWPVEQLPNGDLGTPLLTARMAMHRSVFERIPFDTGYRGNAFREETDFFLTCVEMGFRCVRCLHAKAGHMKVHARALPGGQWTISRPAYAGQMVRNNWRLVRKHGALLRATRQQYGLHGGPYWIQAAFVLSLLGRVRPVSA